MSFTRKMFRILTCLFKKRGLFSILVQNSPKVTKKVLVFRKVARSCSLTKRLLKILKVAKRLPSRIWKGLASKCPYPGPIKTDLTYICSIQLWAVLEWVVKPTTSNMLHECRGLLSSQWLTYSINDFHITHNTPCLSPKKFSLLLFPISPGYYT